MAKIGAGVLQLLAGLPLRVSRRSPRLPDRGKVIVAAACIKAGMAVWVRLTLPSAFTNSDGVMTEMEYATSHGDSLLFACAIVVLLGPLLYRPRARQLRWVLLTLPLIVAGLFANDRRIAWVQIALGLVVLVGMNLRHVLTRRLVRVGVLVSPLILAYVLAGWWLPSRVFRHVHFVRNLVVNTRTDGSLDRSTLYRDAENYNLVNTFRSNPLMGTGFGHPFAQAAPLDDISASGVCVFATQLDAGLRASPVSRPRASSRHSSSRCSWPRAHLSDRARSRHRHLSIACIGACAPRPAHQVHEPTLFLVGLAGRRRTDRDRYRRVANR
jgi:hypothetical protein